jgi:hypothetical protein
MARFRRQQVGCVGDSFPTISAAGGNGSIIHYHAEKSTAAPIVPDQVCSLYTVLTIHCAHSVLYSLLLTLHYRLCRTRCICVTPAGSTWKARPTSQEPSSCQARVERAGGQQGAGQSWEQGGRR